MNVFLLKYVADIKAKRKEAWINNEAALNLEDLKPQDQQIEDFMDKLDESFKINPGDTLGGCQRAIVKYLGMTVEEAYLCQLRFQRKDTETCGWVRDKPIIRPYNYQRVYGQLILCRICNKPIGILRIPKIL